MQCVWKLDNVGIKAYKIHESGNWKQSKTKADLPKILGMPFFQLISPYISPSHKKIFQS